VNWEVFVSAAYPVTKVVLECVDGAFSSSVAVYVWQDQLDNHVLCCKGVLEGVECFIQALQLGAESCIAEVGMCTLICSKNDLSQCFLRGMAKILLLL